MRAAFFALLAAVILANAASAGPREELLAADKAFSDMSLAKGSHAAFLAFMADDARVFQGEHPPLIGKKAVSEYFAEAEKADPNYANARLEWTALEADASPDGVLGWTRGTWVHTSHAADGTAHKLTGYYVTEWRRQTDGAYRFVLDIGGVDRAP